MIYIYIADVLYILYIYMYSHLDLEPSNPSPFKGRVHQLVGRARGLKGQGLRLPLPRSLDTINKIEHQELEHREDHEKAGVTTSFRAEIGACAPPRASLRHFRMNPKLFPPLSMPLLQPKRVSNEVLGRCATPSKRLHQSADCFISTGM